MSRSLRTIVPLLLIILTAALVFPSTSSAQVAVGVSIRIGPPALPVYPQPICPGPGYIWTPGYWAYGPDGYYWVPGTWVVAPAVGLLWTPGYWGFADGLYVWHAGYWGPHVGFYGGINYGFGYTGVGFFGGEWHGGVYHYNTSVTNVNTTIIHNTYNTTVINNNTTINRVSYNGGPRGINARPNRFEEAAAHEHHIQPTSLQTRHEHDARMDRSLRASENHGRPQIAATSKPADFHGRGVVSARDDHGNFNRPDNRNAGRNDRPMGNNVAQHNDRPSNGNSANRGFERNDRPLSAGGNRQFNTNNRANNGRSNSSDMNSRGNDRPNNMNTRGNEPRPNNSPNTRGNDRPNNSHGNYSAPSSNQPRPNEAHQGNPHGSGEPKHR